MPEPIRWPFKDAKPGHYWYTRAAWPPESTYRVEIFDADGIKRVRWFVGIDRIPGHLSDFPYDGEFYPDA